MTGPFEQMVEKLSLEQPIADELNSVSRDLFRAVIQDLKANNLRVNDKTYGIGLEASPERGAILVSLTLVFDDISAAVIQQSGAGRGVSGITRVLPNTYNTFAMEFDFKEVHWELRPRILVFRGYMPMTISATRVLRPNSLPPDVVE